MLLQERHDSLRQPFNDHDLTDCWCCCPACMEPPAHTLYPKLILQYWKEAP